MRKLLPALLLAAAPALAVDLSSVQPVYFWPMEGALDQYIAEQAQTSGVLSVTVDPLLAQSIMTDRIDAEFLAAMEELFPMESGEDEAEAESVEEGALRKKVHNRPQGRSHGTIFLVDVKTRRVQWSTFIGQYDRSPKALHSEAQKVVKRLQAQ